MPRREYVSVGEELEGGADAAELESGGNVGVIGSGRSPSKLTVNEPRPYETEEKAPEQNAVEKPTMREAFGPGGFLERCMIGGYEHRRGQLEMAEMVHHASEGHHYAILEAGTGTGKTL